MACFRQLTLFVALASPALLIAQDVQRSTPVPPVDTEPVVEEGAPPMLGIHWARGFEPSSRLRETARSAKGSPNMIYHGGLIMPYVDAVAIFWGTTWNSSPGDKITGLDSWYNGFANSRYAATSNEYTGSNGQVTSALTYQGHVIDPTQSSGGNNTSAILSVVCNAAAQKPPDPGGNSYYAVYSDTSRGHANYCAYHSFGTCNGTNVQFAYFFKLDGDPGCDPQDSSGLHSQGLAALANVSGHELSEARTDPANPGAWYDSKGEENGDKCAWTYGAPLVTFSNGSQWKIQGEWSNNAYSTGTGYPNSSGQKGCLGGQ